MHNLIPHQHHNEISGEENEIEHNQANTIFDWVKLIFHEDIGEGHLEHVVVSNSFGDDAGFSFTPFSFQYFASCTYANDEKLESFTPHFFIHAKNPYPKGIFEFVDDLRGPPISCNLI